MLKSHIEDIASRRIELGEELERTDENQRNLMERLQVAIRERTETTDAVEEV